VLKKSTNYTQEEIAAAFTKVLNDKSMTSLKKVLPNLKLTKAMLKELFKKDCVQSDFALSAEELSKYIKEVEFSKQEFLEIAKLYKNSLIPDDIIGLFDELSNSNDQALDAYVYILFEYEMIEKIRDIFANTSKEELTAFKALLDLKDAGKQYTLDSICYNN
jgi:lipid A disaccharide synthetase